MKEKKTQDEMVAEANQERLLSTMKGNRYYKAAMTARDPHYVVESEKGGEEGGNDCGEGSERMGHEKWEETGQCALVLVPTTTKTALTNQKVEILRDQRRKIGELEQLLDTGLAKESDRLTAILVRVANALMPGTADNYSTDQSANT